VILRKQSNYVTLHNTHHCSVLTPTTENYTEKLAQIPWLQGFAEFLFFTT